MGFCPRGVASRGAGLLVRRGWCRGRPSVAPSARSREGGLEGLRPRRWRAGGLPRVWRGAPGRCAAGVAPLDIVRGVVRTGKGSQEQCQGRHAPVSARGPRARDVGWGWPHLQSRAGGRRAHLLERGSRERPRSGVERDTSVGETEGGASPTLRVSRDACPHNPPHQGFGWISRQVMAQTSSKSCKAVVA